MRVNIIDYGAGNLHSIAKAIERVGGEVNIVRPEDALDAEVLVLPGVGSFGAAAVALADARQALREAIRDGLPTIGICLGMQLLFEDSDEGPGQGLGVITGRVERLRARRTPQIGWNTIEWTDGALAGESPLDVAYFANRYVCRPRCSADISAWSTHENDRFPAVVRRGRAIGVQFHPEKSSTPGLAFLKRVLERASSGALHVDRGPTVGAAWADSSSAPAAEGHP